VGDAADRRGAKGHIPDQETMLKEYYLARYWPEVSEPANKKVRKR